MSAARDDGIERRAPASRPPATGFSFGLKGALRLVLAGLMAMAALMALLPRVSMPSWPNRWRTSVAFCCKGSVCL